MQQQGSGNATGGGGGTVPSVPTGKVVLDGANGASTVTVEVVKSPGLVQKGLMYRKFMPADAGMVFLMGEVDDHYFWMKNTLIPLDMLFIARDGRIVKIAERTVPLSQAVIVSDGDVAAVLELNGGTAARLGLRPGDRVRYAAFAGAD